MAILLICAGTLLSVFMVNPIPFLVCVVVAIGASKVGDKIGEEDGVGGAMHTPPRPDSGSGLMAFLVWLISASFLICVCVAVLMLLLGHQPGGM